MNEKLVTIKTFTFRYEIDIAIAKLADQGIPAVAVKSSFGDIGYYRMNSPVGEFILRVKEEDVKQALDILSDDDNLTIIDDIEIENMDFHDNGQRKSHLTCPRCGSNKTIMKTPLYLKIVSYIFIFGFFNKANTRDKNKCLNCGLEWV